MSRGASLASASYDALTAAASHCWRGADASTPRLPSSAWKPFGKASYWSSRAVRSSGRSSSSCSAARRPRFFFDARDRFDDASGFSGSSPFFVSLAWRSAMADVRPRLHVASRYLCAKQPLNFEVL